MKICACFFIIIISSYCGYLYNEKFSKRVSFYKDYKDFNSILKTNISFSKKTIPVLVDENKDSNSFALTVNNYLKGNKKISKDFLTLNEKKEIVFYCDNIGKSDVNEQINFLSLKEKELDEKINKVSKEKDLNKNLYIKLGFLFGLIISVLII